MLVLTSTFPRWVDDEVPAFVFTLSKLLSKFYTIQVLAPWDLGAKKNEEMSGVQVKRFQYFFSGMSLAYGGGISDNIKKNPLKLLLIPFYLLAQTYAIFKELKQTEYDLIHAHWLIPQGITAIIACYLAGIDPKQKLVLSCHGSDVNGFKGRLGTFIKKWVCKRVRRLTVVSASLKQELDIVGNKTPVDVIPMGSDFVSTFYRNLDVEKQAKTTIFVGRLIEQKGVWLLLRVFKKVVSELPDAKLILVGEGPLKKDIQQYLLINELEHNVELLGFRNHNELPLYYNKAKVCVVPSLINEGFGLTVVESMGCECITLASDFPSARELILSGHNGFLFPAGNELELLKTWMNALLSNQADVGSQARSSVKGRYGWEKTVEEFSKLFKEIINQEINVSE
jgi:glycosyltransferase involved in cell wall biosynthesis